MPKGKRERKPAHHLTGYWASGEETFEEKAKKKCIRDCEKLFALKDDHKVVQRDANDKPLFASDVERKKFLECESKCEKHYS